MPTGTFFRLPQEKRDRLIQAAWEELQRTRFSQVSINRIIRRARIPRGSFYQYFEDKEDLLHYLLSDAYAQFQHQLEQLLKKTGGDLFAAALLAFDRLPHPEESTEAWIDRLIRLIQVNPGTELLPCMLEYIGQGPKLPIELLDLRQFRSQEPEFIQQTAIFLLICITSAAVELFHQTSPAAQLRQTLRTRIEIIKYGACSAAQTPHEGGTLH